MKLFKIIYLMIGIILTASVLLFTATGLPAKDRALYKEACALEDIMEKKIWPGLRIKEYPVAIRKGSTEYVIDETEVRKRKPVLPVIACTAYKVEEVVNVFLPCKSELDSIGHFAEGLSAGTQEFFIDQFSINNKSITNNQYIAILYHETLHAFQIKYYEKQIQAMQNIEEDEDIEEWMGELEKDPAISTLYEKQAVLLSRLVHSSGADLNRKDFKEFFLIREELQQTFEAKAGSEKAKRIKKQIELTELLEGTARYVEMKTAEVLSDKGLHLQYLNSLKETVRGKEKYYRSGMGLCLLLDRFDQEWKQKAFTKGCSLAELLENTMEDFVYGG